jgi:hypothetical protein
MPPQTRIKVLWWYRFANMARSQTAPTPAIRIDQPAIGSCAPRDATAFDALGLGSGGKKGAVTTVSKYQARVRKCGVCNGAGRYYPIDEGPLQECQICNGLGLLKVKNDRGLAPGRSRAVKVGQSNGASSSSTESLPSAESASAEIRPGRVSTRLS